MIDPQQEVLRTLIQESVKGVLSILARALPQAFTKEQSDAIAALTADSLTRNQTIKPLGSDAPTLLSHIHVPCRFRSGRREELDEDAIVNALLDERHCIVMGTAGSGKTMFMRTLQRRLLLEQDRAIPIYVELRDWRFPDVAPLASDASNTLLDGVFNHLAAKTQIDRATFDASMSGGHFILILDGFDEVPKPARQHLGVAIKQAADRYPKTPIILSSRPEAGFQALAEFRTFHVLPFTFEQVAELVRRLPIQRGKKTIKKRFLAQLEQGQFDQYRDFIQVPLLAALMLLMYEEFAEIPAKQHLFYEQAFETLLRRHDATKLYKRVFHSGASWNEVRRLFGAMCAASYFNQHYRFSAPAFRELIELALSIAEISIDADLFADDLHESICVMAQDGTQSIFIHRTFQEFFAAQFLRSRRDDEVLAYLRQVESRGMTDRLFRFLFDVDQDRIERTWVVKRLQELEQELERRSVSPFLDQMRYLDARARMSMRGATIPEAEFSLTLTTGSYPEYTPLAVIADLYGQTHSLHRDYAISPGAETIVRNRNALAVRIFSKSGFVKLAPGEALTVDVNVQRQEIAELDWLFKTFGADRFISDLVATIRAQKQSIETRLQSRSTSFAGIFARRGADRPAWGSGEDG